MTAPRAGVLEELDGSPVRQRPAADAAAWPRAMMSASIVALSRPRLWAFALLGFLARGGLVALVFPMLVLPTFVGLSNTVGPTSVTAAGPTPRLVAMIATWLAIAIGAVMGGTLIASASEVALYGHRRPQEGGPRDPGLASPEARATARPGRRLVRRVATVRVALLGPVGVALALAVPAWVQVGYNELVLPSNLAVPLPVRVVAGAPLATATVIVTWLACEVLGGLAARRIVIGGSSTGGALAAAFIEIVRAPVASLLTTFVAVAGTLLVVAATVALVASAWDRARIALVDGADVISVLGATLVLVVAWATCLLAAGVAAAWRSALWTAEAAAPLTGRDEPGLDARATLGETQPGEQAPVTDSQACPECGADVPAGRLSCRACGALLAAVLGRGMSEEGSAVEPEGGADEPEGWATRPERLAADEPVAAPRHVAGDGGSAAADRPLPEATPLPADRSRRRRRPVAPRARAGRRRGRGRAACGRPPEVTAPPGATATPEATAQPMPPMPPIPGAYLPPAVIVRRHVPAPAREPVAAVTPLSPEPRTDPVPGGVRPGEAADVPASRAPVLELPFVIAPGMGPRLVAAGAALGVVAFVLPWVPRWRDRDRRRVREQLLRHVGSGGPREPGGIPPGRIEPGARRVPEPGSALCGAGPAAGVPGRSVRRVRLDLLHGARRDGDRDLGAGRGGVPAARRRLARHPRPARRAVAGAARLERPIGRRCPTERLVHCAAATRGRSSPPSDALSHG